MNETFSKSARKREHLALQDLGEALTRLAPAELEALPIDDRLLEAVTEARAIRSRSALRRQRQLIGKLMRDADAAAIRASLAHLGADDRESRRRFHEAENWRDRLCAGGGSALAEFAARCGCDTGMLSKLVADLQAAPDDARRRGIRRRIFRTVHDCLAASPGLAAG